MVRPSTVPLVAGTTRMTCMKPSETKSAPVGATARPARVVELGRGRRWRGARRRDTARSSPCHPRRRRGRRRRRRAVVGPGPGGRQQHRLVAAVGHQQVAGAIDGDGHGVPGWAPPPGRPGRACRTRRCRRPCRGGRRSSPARTASCRAPARTRTRQLAVSAMKRSPAASRATSVGWSSCAGRCRHPVPVVARLSRARDGHAATGPAGRTTCTRCAVASAMNTSPWASTATPLG